MHITSKPYIAHLLLFSSPPYLRHQKETVTPVGPLRAVNHPVGHHHPSFVVPIVHGYPTWEYVSAWIPVLLFLGVPKRIFVWGKKRN